MIQPYGVIENQDIITIEDGKADAPAKVVCNISPVQDLHGYDYPWAGGNGKNLFNIGDFIQQRGATVTISGNNIRLVGDGSQTYQDGRVPFSTKSYAAGTYYVKFKVKSGATLDNFTRVCLRNQSGTIKGSVMITSGTYEYSGSITVDESCYLSIMLNGNYTGSQYSTDVTIYDLIVSSTDAPYEPYENICPITGWKGCNLAVTGDNFLDTSKNSTGYTINAFGNLVSQTGATTSEFIPFKNYKTYVTGAKAQQNSSGYRSVNYYDSEGNFVHQFSYNVTVQAGREYNLLSNDLQDKVKMVRNCYRNGDANKKFMIKEGETTPVYEAFKGNIYHITWENDAGIVYGGTLNVSTGVLTISKAFVDMGNIAWTQHSTHKGIFSYEFSDSKQGILNEGEHYCSMFKCNLTDSFRYVDYSSFEDNTIYRNANAKYTYIKCTRFENQTANDFINFVNGQMLVYELASPQTVQLTPTQVTTILGHNVVLCDTGTIASFRYSVNDSDYYNNIKAGNLTHVRMTFTGQNIVLEDQDIDLSAGVVVNDILNGETDLVFGKAISKQVTTTFLNSSRLDGLKWTSEFTLEFGVDIGSPATTYWVQIGVFSGEKPNNITSSRTIEFTAYDRMSLFNGIADDFVKGITYPATIQDIYDGLCSYVGLTNVSGDELPTIMSRSYASAPADMEGYTCRDILAWIAESCGCYAKINADGNVQMVWFTDNTSYAITGTEEFSVESGDINDGMTWDEADQLTWDEIDELTWNDVCGYSETYRIDSILVKQLNNGLDVSYPYATDGNVYLISDNPFLSVGSYSDVTSYIAPLYNRMVTLGGYIPARIECVGNWCVEAGDIITADVNSTTITFPIFMKEMRWNGGTNDSYETTGNKQRALYSSDATKQRNMTSKKIEMYVGDNFYQKRSGIEIEEQGVIIEGGQYVRIKAGHEFDKWTFDPEGLEFEGHAIVSDTPVEGKYVRFGIAPFTGENIPNMECGLFPVYDDSADYADLRLKVWKYRANASISKPQQAYLHLEAIDTVDNDQGYSDEGSQICVYPDKTYSNAVSGWLGKRNNMYRRIYGESVYYYFLESLSSREAKDNITPMKDFGDAIDKLQPVSFMYKTESAKKSGGRTSYGLVYEDTIDVMPEICNGAKDEKAINYMSLIPILLTEVQSLRKRVAELEKQVFTKEETKGDEK